MKIYIIIRQYTCDIYKYFLNGHKTIQAITMTGIEKGQTRVLLFYYIGLDCRVIRDVLWEEGEVGTDERWLKFWGMARTQFRRFRKLRNNLDHIVY